MFAIVVNNPTTPEPIECLEKVDNNDDNLFAFQINMIEVFVAVGTLKNYKAVGNDGVSVEVLKISLPVIGFVLKEFLSLSLPRG